MEIITGVKRNPVRVLMYGPGGLGKSKFGANSPNPIFIQTEEGVDHLGADRYGQCHSFSDIIDQISEVINRGHEGHDTVVLDSADWAERLIHKELCIKYNGQSMTDENVKAFGFNKGWALALPYWERIMKGLNICRSKHNMNIVILAHEKIDKFKRPDGSDYTRYSPDLHEEIATKLIEEMDAVLFLRLETFSKESDVGFNKTKTIATSTETRVINTQDGGSWRAKNRFDLPAEMPMDKESPYASFQDGLDAFYGDI